MSVESLQAYLLAQLEEKCVAGSSVEDFAEAVAVSIYAEPPTSDGGTVFTMVAGADPTSNLVWTTVGAMSVDLSAFDGYGFTYSVLLEATTGRTCSSRLYNLTDGAAVTDTTLTSTSVTPELKTATLTCGAGHLEDAIKTYLVQIKMDSGATPEQVACRWAALEKN